MDKLYYSKKRWQDILKHYLSNDKSLRVLYTSTTCKDVPSVVLYKENKDRCDTVYTYQVESSFQEDNPSCVFNYDIILRHFNNYSISSSEDQEEVLNMRNKELDNVKKIALYISKREKRRVSFGFVYYAFNFERNYDYDNKYMFYSIKDGILIEEEVDMSDTCLCDSDFMGKIIYMHNCLVKQDKGKGFIKSLTIM